jgi:hypothetical protein
VNRYWGKYQKISTSMNLDLSKLENIKQISNLKKLGKNIEGNIGDICNTAVATNHPKDK